MITCPREATSDHVAAPVQCEALKEMLLNGMTTVTDLNGNMEVDISQWSKMEPQLSHLIGADHKQGTNQSDMCYLFRCCNLTYVSCIFVMLVDLFTQLRVEGNCHLYAVCTGIPTMYYHITIYQSFNMLNPPFFRWCHRYLE